MGSGCIDPHFLGLGPSWEWSAQAAANLRLGKDPRYRLDRRLVDPRAGLDNVKKIKFLTVWGLEI
jgi:hypothetical protein